MKEVTDSAFVVSVHYDSPEGAVRINLKWKGRHEISDFDFDHLGDVIGCGTERWAIVQFSRNLHVPNLPPESQFAPVILQVGSDFCATAKRLRVIQKFYRLAVLANSDL
jgi:hypothetical protein